MPREYQWAKDQFGSIIRDPLYEAMLMRVRTSSLTGAREVGFGMFTCMLQMCEQSHASVDQLLTALWHAEYHGRYNLYRTAIILLADVGLEFGMTKWCKRLMDEVMPQVCLNARGFVSACLFVPAHDPFVPNHQYRCRPDHE